ncbi:BZ3500_MvSof-1268-A1-R1_Chr1-2g01323 [Microbotryum saponariae]|uniref:BZ3500_MvSof-1268-A1-R1_Chr1-2g01323 protein n=1 Tax=Microbotryum saponariae TaxID=289078 RepID=A0A2X0KFN6_9BASI|nr:BZ3500_MvSof-1268-A1-R1_Chr1-2g01323 [Microbotryum saponariae]SCZ97096.1 BZ3501_MvSof-1269-A2-R1_Chr1-2g00922 [Microbotryum saponariae]
MHRTTCSSFPKGFNDRTSTGACDLTSSTGFNKQGGFRIAAT